LDGFRKPAILFVDGNFFNRTRCRALEKLRVTGDAVRDLQVIILNHEGAPSEVEVWLTDIDSLSELLANASENEEHLLFVCFELLFVFDWMNKQLLLPHLFHFEYELDEGNRYWNFEEASTHHQNTDVKIV
jgi:hypothetical protein